MALPGNSSNAGSVMTAQICSDEAWLLREKELRSQERSDLLGYSLPL